MKTFSPNLIPNNPKDGSFDMNAAIIKNGGYDKYIIFLKQDGVRLQFQDELLSRSLKKSNSVKVNERFQGVVDELKKLNICLDAEFYAHGQKFNSIFRFFSKKDVTCPKYKAQLEKEFKKDPELFKKDYDGLSIEFLTTFHNDLQAHIFDGYLTDRPDLIGFKERMEEIKSRVSKSILNSDILANYAHIKFKPYHQVNTKEELDALYESALYMEYEGLVLVHENHQYKFGRNTLKEGTLLKLKDDAIEFDAVVLDVAEATSVKDGVEKTTNELGRSVTSKKKGDRENSGIAKGFKVAYTDDSGQCLGIFTVCLRGFNNEKRKAIFENRAEYIGKHFVYTGMSAVKDFPRHAYFSHWRDEK